MKYASKMLVFGVLMLFSLVVLVVFFASIQPHDYFYIRQLWDGDAVVHIDVARNWFDIVSSTVYGFVRFPLSSIALVAVFAVVFLASLAMLVRTYYAYP